MNIGHILINHARYRPDHLAFVCKDRQLTYAELNQSVNKIANALYGHGIRKGDKVSMLLPNCSELWELYWAIAKIGAVAVPLSPLLSGTGLSNQLNNADTSLVIATSCLQETVNNVMAQLTITPADVWLTDVDCPDRFVSFHERKAKASSAEPADPGIQPDDLYNIIYSSGTTGAPKGIMHTHRIRADYMSLFGSYFRMTPESVVLHSGSIIFNGSFLTTMPVMFHGGTFILHSSFDVDHLVEDIRDRKVTHTILVPSQITAALQHPEFTARNAASLEMILSVGAPLHQSQKEKLNSLIPDVFYELYGLTEGFVTILDKTDFYNKPGSVGCPPQFFDMKIVDDEGRELPSGGVGEIVGRGPILMKGYYNDPDRTAEAIRNGWLYTGDLGYTDEDGYLYLAGRKKDLIISGGVNVYPKDIEAVIIKHPEITDAAVFGVEDERWGETPVAALICRNGFSGDKAALRSWINERLEARFQKVSDLLFLDEFPRNVAGKTLKRTIKELYLKQQENIEG